MTRSLIALAVLAFLVAPASAAEDTLAVTPGTGALIGGKTTGGNFHTDIHISDPTSPEQRQAVDSTGHALVNGNVGGYDSGTAPTVNATVAAATHAVGESVGGLFTIPMARTAGGGGLINNLNWISANGDTTQKVVRLWDKNPTGTTCTDHAAFVSAAADDVHLLTLPLSITPLAPVNTTGDAKTYASLTGLVLNFRNQDTSPTTNVYVCVVTVASDTLDNNTKVYLTLSGVQD